MASKARPIIGKFVIENLTVGMYDDPRCIFREYVQNAADAIDKAVDSGLISAPEGSIFVQIKEDRRYIEFEDNGTGIPRDSVVRLLQDIAQSEKEMGKDKGFRGIGRLGGLAYCETLIFETSFKGESEKSVMTWDAKTLKSLVANRAEKEEAADVIARITEFESEPEDPSKHYFRVKLVNVTNKDLLQVADIKDYLRMVAPVKYDTGFIFRKKIYEALQQKGLAIDEYSLNVNGDPIFKGYTTLLYGEVNGQKKKIGDITDVHFFDGADKNGNPLFWGWHSISTVQNEQLKKVNKARGLRVRKHNIQIGDENRLSHLFREPRFNFYVVGEVFALSDALVPNGRRDDFEDSPAFFDFKEKLRPICSDIKKVSYDSSALSNAKKDLEELQKFKGEVEEIQKGGVIDKSEIFRLETELEQKREKAKKAEKTISTFKEKVAAGDDGLLSKVYTQIVSEELPKVDEIRVSINDQKPVYRTDKLSKLTKAERKLLSTVFGVIKSALAQELAENLIQKIEEKFK